jgi:hypothetical protein
MNSFIKKPIEELETLLAKLNRTHEDCHCYDYTECDYIASQVEDREAFEKAVQEAIQNLKIASNFTKDKE